MKEWVLLIICALWVYMVWRWSRIVLSLLHEILVELQIIRRKVRAADYKEFDDHIIKLMSHRAHAVREQWPSDEIAKIDEQLQDMRLQASQK